MRREEKEALALTRRSAATFGAIVTTALGLVLGYAISDGVIQPVFIYGKRLLLVTACLGAAFFVGMVIEYYIRKSHPTLIAPKGSGEALTFRQSVERRFRGDRTDEEYSRAERCAVLAIVLSIFALIFILGRVGAVAIATVALLLLAADSYISLKSADQHFKAKAVGTLLSGTFHGLFLGYASAIWWP